MSLTTRFSFFPAPSYYSVWQWHAGRSKKKTMAAASSPEAQKELLLAAGIHEQVGWNWQPGLPLGEFQGVSVDGTGLVVGLDFSEQKKLKFDLAVFTSLTSLQVVNFERCENARGEC